MKVNITPTYKQHLAWEGLRRYNKVYFGAVPDRVNRGGCVKQG
jgi:hypothetical protein